MCEGSKEFRVVGNFEEFSTLRFFTFAFVLLLGRIQMDNYSYGEDLFEQDNEDIFSVVTADIGPVRRIT